VTDAPGVGETAPSPAIRIRAAGFLILIALVALLWAEPGWIERLQTAGFDALQSSAPRATDKLPVTIVAIDDATIAKVGQWPLPRTLLAQLVNTVGSAHPAVIGIDILMPDADPLSPARVLRDTAVGDELLAKHLAVLPSNDRELAQAIAGAPVVMALAGTTEKNDARLIATLVKLHEPKGREGPPGTEIDVERFNGVLGIYDELDRAATGRGMISSSTRGGRNRDGREMPSDLRRIPLLLNVRGTPVPGFAVELLRVAQRAPFVDALREGNEVVAVATGQLVVPAGRKASMRLYYARTDERRFVSALDVLDGKADPAMFRDHVVLIGATGTGLGDVQTTPLGEQMGGAEVQAQAIENMLDGTWLSRPRFARALELALFLAVGTLVVVLTPSLSPRNGAALMLASVVLPLLAAYAAFRAGRWVFDAVTPVLALAMLATLLMFLTLRDTTQQRRSLQRVLQSARENEARVAGEFAAAQRIQTGLLPSSTLLAEDPRIEVAAAMTPAREVGGDLYDFFRLDERRLFFLVGDVAGKGLSASIFMAVSKALCKSTALRVPDSDAGALMSAANVEVSRDNPEMLFVTAFAGILDLVTGDLWYCNAGHENPYVLKPAAGVVGRIVDGDGPPLCAVDNYHYHGGEYRMRPGEVLCVVTDGVNDARNRAGDVYGGRRAEALLTGLLPADPGAQAVVDALRGDVEGFVAGAEMADDLTVLALRYNGPR